MSNISRRKFLKGAGAAALAVAAAGVLAGCGDNKVPGTDVPDVPEVTSKTVKVYFTEATPGYKEGEAVGSIYEATVLKDAKVLDPTTIPADKLPETYVLAAETPVEIIDNGNQIFAFVPVKRNAVVKDDEPETGTKTTKTIKLTLMDIDTYDRQEITFDLYIGDYINANDIDEVLAAKAIDKKVVNPDFSVKLELNADQTYGFNGFVVVKAI